MRRSSSVRVAECSGFARLPCSPCRFGLSCRFFCWRLSNRRSAGRRDVTCVHTCAFLFTCLLALLLRPARCILSSARRANFTRFFFPRIAGNHLRSQSRVAIDRDRAPYTLRLFIYLPDNRRDARDRHCDMSTRRTATASDDSCQRDVEAPLPSDRTSRGYRALIVSSSSLFDILSASSRVLRMFVLASSR